VYNTLTQFFGKEFSRDALRNIIAIILPAVLLFYVINLNFAIAFAVGTILSSLTDLPGNRLDKRQTAAYCIPLFFVAALVTAINIQYHSPLILLILAFAGFACSMLLALGPRVGAVGNLTMIVVSFTIGLKPQHILEFTLALTLGTIWFFIVSLIQSQLTPYRSLKYALNDGFLTMSGLLELKIKCYDDNTPLDQAYKALTLVHIRISDQLESVRSLLLRETELIASESAEKTVWLNKVYRLIDLYELLTAVDNDYDTIREKLADTQSLPLIRAILHCLAQEVATLADDQEHRVGIDTLQRTTVNSVLQQLIFIQKQQAEDVAQILQSVVDHVNHILEIIDGVKGVHVVADHTWIDSNAYKHFIPAQHTFNTIRKQLNFKSPIFRYSLRMALLLALGGLIGVLAPEYKFSSWTILTIILVARPSYAITQKRNYERIVGSLIGLVLSIVITYVCIKNTPLLLVIAALSLYGFFLFNKPSYLISVVFITLCIMLCLNIYEGNLWDLLGSRIAFTLLGSVLALLGCFIVPVNQHKTVGSLTEVLISHYEQYFNKVNAKLQGEKIDALELRLARKNAQNSLAKFYDTISQVQNEPQNRKKDWRQISEFQTLAYRIHALLVGLSVSLSKTSPVEQDYTSNQRLLRIQALIADLNYISQKKLLLS